VAGVENELDHGHEEGGHPQPYHQPNVDAHDERLEAQAQEDDAEQLACVRTLGRT